MTPKYQNMLLQHYNIQFKCLGHNMARLAYFTDQKFEENAGSLCSHTQKYTETSGIFLFILSQ